MTTSKDGDKKDMIANEAAEAWLTELVELHCKDTLIIRQVKSEIPKKLFKQLNYEIYESENYCNFRIIDHPIGEIQGERMNVWVDQHVGICGDDYSGIVCFKLPNGKYIAWDYWM